MTTAQKIAIRPKTVEEITIKDGNLMQSVYDEIANREGKMKLEQKLQKCKDNGCTALLFESTHVFNEYMEIDQDVRNDRVDGDFERAYHKILQFIINCIIADPIEGFFFNKKNHELIMEAGKLLHACNSMDHELILSIIPSRFIYTVYGHWAFYFGK